MHTLVLAIAVALAVVAVGAFVAVLWSTIDTPSLDDVPPLVGEAPSLSLIVAGRDEEKHVRSAVESLLRQQYPRYEVIVVNDRSEDRTGEILDDIAARDPRLRVVHVRDLPDGWLGKNNALHAGAAAATGELLLFADADVIMEPSTVSRAVRLMRAEGADHLTLAPEMISHSLLLRLLVQGTMIALTLWLRPWRARVRTSPAYMGIGAFNLVSRAAFEAVGGFTRIRLRPDDDLMLGKIIKRGGFRQIVAAGQGQAKVEWYPSVAEFARGLRKNSLAAAYYSVTLAVVSVAAGITFATLPWLAVWFTDGITRACFGITMLAQMLTFIMPGMNRTRLPLWAAFAPPIVMPIFNLIVLAAILRTVRRGGIEWRGRFYDLRALRENRV